MGYDLHIMRGHEWSDPDGPHIGMEEWLAVIDADPSLDLRDELAATSPSGEIRVPSPGLGTWHGHPEIPEVHFSFRGGKISVRTPDEVVLAKMVQIAAALDAHVQGDDGEFYPPSTV